VHRRFLKLVILQDTGRRQQKTHFRELFGSLVIDCSAAAIDSSNCFRTAKVCSSYSDGRLFNNIEQLDVPAFGKQPRIESNNPKRSEACFDLRFQTGGLLRREFFVVRDQLLEQAAVIMGLAINRMNSIQTQQFGEFAGSDGIAFIRIFAAPTPKCANVKRRLRRQAV